ncbi:MAG: sugar ABC transporter permease [Clostridia bacterium]|nr:sugar ABC transporter permease [Clostridia bacterium]
MNDKKIRTEEKAGAVPVGAFSEAERVKKKPESDKWKKLWGKIVRSRQIYLMLLPVVLFYIVYQYVPMYGIVLAWKDWRPKYGIFGSPWVGWKNFEWVFARPELGRAIKNTLIISCLKLAICFPLPIFVAILLNEMNGTGTKKCIQTAMYLPHFISWVILGGLVKMILAVDDGVINNIISALGGERVSFLNDKDAFYPILLFSEIWKGTGWGTIIYIAAISGIDPSLYEAATIDGCKRGGLIFRITIPMITPVITVMFIMQLSNIMNAGFDPVYNLYNKGIYETADILDTYVYRLFMEDHREAVSSAVSLFKTVVNFVFLIGGNIITKKINGYSMYSID